MAHSALTGKIQPQSLNCLRVSIRSFLVFFLFVASARAQANGPGYALLLTNATVTVPGFGNSIPTNEITIEFWQRMSTNRNVNTFILSPDSSANACHAYIPYLDGKVYWAFGNTGAGGQLSYAPPTSLVGSWQHFALVASQSGNYMAIYRNGVLEAQKTGMAPLAPGNRSLILGGLAMNEDLDEVRIWNVARSADEIRTNMDRSLTGNEPGLVAYWRFDEGTGTNAFDSTTNGFTGHYRPAHLGNFHRANLPAGSGDPAGQGVAGYPRHGQRFRHDIRQRHRVLV